MHIFKDDTGQDWELAITVGAIKRVKGYLPDVDLLKVDEADPAARMPEELTGDERKNWEPPPLQLRLTGNPVLVCECICAALKPQLDAKSVTPDQFYDRMAGPGLRDGLAAFWEDLDDFFQSLGRSDLSALAKLQRKLLAEIVSANKSAIEAWETKREEKRPPGNPSTIGSLSTDSPESSELIQILEP